MVEGPHLSLPHVIGLTAAAATLLSMGCAQRGAAPAPAEAVRAITLLHQDLNHRDYDRAHERVDYGFRLSEMLRDVWRDGLEEDRARAVAMARRQFEETTERFWTTHFSGRETTTRAWRGKNTAVWVAVRAARDPDPPFEWRYRLHQRGDRWLVTQREHHVGSTPSQTSRFFPMAVGALAKELGRQPTLGELNANLPSLQRRMKIRTYRVPPLRSPPGSR